MNLKENIREILILIAILIVILVLLINPLDDSSDKEPTIPERISREIEVNLDPIPVLSPREISIGNQKIVIPDGYIINTILDGSNSDDFNCFDRTDCNIYLIQNNEYTFYISIGGDFGFGGSEINNFQINNHSSGVLLNLASGQEVDFIQDTYQVSDFNEDGEEIMTSDDTQKVIRSYYGCFDELVCIATPRLSPFASVNSAEVQAFLDFISKLSIENV